MGVEKITLVFIWNSYKRKEKRKKKLTDLNLPFGCRNTNALFARTPSFRILSMTGWLRVPSPYSVIYLIRRWHVQFRYGSETGMEVAEIIIFHQQREAAAKYCTLTRSCSLELISFRASAGICSGAVNAGVLAHVAGEGTLINVCKRNEKRKPFRRGTAVTMSVSDNIQYFLNRPWKRQHETVTAYSKALLHHIWVTV